MSSATQRFPSSMADSVFSVVPDLANGVRRPATMATRRPGAARGGMRGSYRVSGSRAWCRDIGSPGTFQVRPGETMWRQRTIESLKSTTFDVLVVGGGITGCGIARDAAMRGLRVALVEQDDFASGTSSRSSRLVHGGVRYLEHGQLSLVFESSRERRTLLRIAPHLVRPT